MNVQRDNTTIVREGQFSPVAAFGRGKTRRVTQLMRLRHTLSRLLSPFRQHIPPNGVTPREAVTSFLGTMAAEAARTLPGWERMLRTGLYDCSLSYNARHAFFDTHPTEDYHFAGIIALEAARIRALYPTAEADALLAEIGMRVDAVARRDDRIVSDLVFEIISRINMAQNPALQKMPHDVATKAILKQLEIGANDETRPLMSDVAFRHALGEPLATGFRNWWAAFQSQFVLYLPGEEDADAKTVNNNAGIRPTKQPWRPRRAKPL